jgi:hypothetical protein
MPREIAFEMAVSSIRFGPGVTREVGMDLADLGARNVLVLTDPVLRSLSPVQTVLESLEANGIPATLYDRVRVEPTDESFLDAIAFGNMGNDKGNYDAIVAVGGGSTIDTAKAVNLYVTYPPADFLDYVNPPIGKGLPVPGPLKPLIAIPTTAGTGSETTGVSIFDLTRMHAKTGIASRRLKPTLGMLDPDNTRAMPPQVRRAASTFSVTRLNRSPRYPSPNAPGPIAPCCARPIKDRIPSVTCGRSKPCAWFRSIWSAPWRIRPTTKRARTCCWRHRTQASDSETRACTCRTECPTRYRAT